MIDWKEGDLAQCVDDKDSFGRPIGVQKMNIYTVTHVRGRTYPCNDCGFSHFTVILQLKEASPLGGYKGFDHRFFRKVDPIVEEDESEEEVKLPPVKTPEMV